MARVARRAIAIDDRMCVCVYLAQFIIARGPVALSKYYAPLRTQKPRAYLSTAKAQKKGCKLGENTQFALPIQKSQARTMRAVDSAMEVCERAGHGGGWTAQLACLVAEVQALV